MPNTLSIHTQTVIMDTPANGLMFFHCNDMPYYAVELTASEIRKLKEIPVDRSYISVTHAIIAYNLNGNIDITMSERHRTALNYYNHLKARFPNLDEGLGYKLCNKKPHRGSILPLFQSQQGVLLGFMGLLQAVNKISEAELKEMEAKEQKKLEKQLQSAKQSAEQAESKLNTKKRSAISLATSLHNLKDKAANEYRTAETALNAFLAAKKHAESIQTHDKKVQATVAFHHVYTTAVQAEEKFSIAYALLFKESCQRQANQQPQQLNTQMTLVKASEKKLHEESTKTPNLKLTLKSNRNKQREIYKEALKTFSAANKTVADEKEQTKKMLDKKEAYRRVTTALKNFNNAAEEAGKKMQVYTAMCDRETALIRKKSAEARYHTIREASNSWNKKAELEKIKSLYDAVCRAVDAVEEMAQQHKNFDGPTFNAVEIIHRIDFMACIEVIKANQITVITERPYGT